MSAIDATLAQLARDDRMIDYGTSTDIELREYLLALDTTQVANVMRLALMHSELVTERDNLRETSLDEAQLNELDNVVSWSGPAVIVETSSNTVTLELTNTTPGSIAIDYRVGRTVSIVPVEINTELLGAVLA